MTMRPALGSDSDRQTYPSQQRRTARDAREVPDLSEATVHVAMGSLLSSGIVCGWNLKRILQSVMEGTRRSGALPIGPHPRLAGSRVSPRAPNAAR